MIYLPVSTNSIQDRVKRIFDFFNDPSNSEEPMEQKYNNAWYELFGMKNIFEDADNSVFTDRQAQFELDEIRQCLAQALSTVEKLYDQSVDGKKQLDSEFKSFPD